MNKKNRELSGGCGITGPAFPPMHPAGGGGEHGAMHNTKLTMASHASGKKRVPHSHPGSGSKKRVPHTFDGY